MGSTRPAGPTRPTARAGPVDRGLQPCWWAVLFFVGRFVFCGPLDFLWAVEFFGRPFLWAVLVGRYIAVFCFSWLGLVDYFLWAVFCGPFCFLWAVGLFVDR